MPIYIRYTGYTHSGTVSFNDIENSPITRFHADDVELLLDKLFESLLNSMCYLSLQFSSHGLGTRSVILHLHQSDMDPSSKC